MNTWAKWRKVWSDPTPGYATDRDGYVILAHRTWRVSPAGWVGAVRVGDPVSGNQLAMAYRSTRDEVLVWGEMWIADHLAACEAAGVGRGR